MVLDFKSMECSVVVKGISQREVKADAMILPIEFAQTHLNVLYQNLDQDSKKYEFFKNNRL